MNQVEKEIVMDELRVYLLTLLVIADTQTANYDTEIDYHLIQKALQI